MGDDLFQTDAEISVLSILLHNPDKYFETQDLKSYMFSSEPNQLIYKLIVDLMNKKLVPDLNMIETNLGSTGTILKAGGKDYLNYIYKFNSNESNLKEFVDIVVNSYKAKSLISLATQAQQQVITSGNPDGAIESLRSSLDKLSSISASDAIESLDTIMDMSLKRIEDRVNNPGIPGLKTGLKSLDTATSGMQKGTLWIIAGRPGMAKSGMVCNISYNQGKEEIPTLIISREMPKEQLAKRLITIDTQIENTAITMGYLKPKDMVKIRESVKELKKLPIYIDSNFFSTPEYIYSTIRKYNSNFGVKVVYLDYLQLVVDRDNNATHALGKVTRMAKLLANELGMTIVLLSQLNRNVEMRDNKRPILADLRQSGNIEEDADIVVGLYRDEIYNLHTKNPDMMEAIILKNREGPIGTIPLTFVKENGIIKDR